MSSLIRICPCRGKSVTHECTGDEGTSSTLRASAFLRSSRHLLLSLPVTTRNNGVGDMDSQPSQSGREIARESEKGRERERERGATPASQPWRKKEREREREEITKKQAFFTCPPHPHRGRPLKPRRLSFSVAPSRIVLGLCKIWGLGFRTPCQAVSTQSWKVYRFIGKPRSLSLECTQGVRLVVCSMFYRSHQEPGMNLGMSCLAKSFVRSLFLLRIVVQPCISTRT